MSAGAGEHVAQILEQVERAADQDGAVRARDLARQREGLVRVRRHADGCVLVGGSLYLLEDLRDVLAGAG